MGVVKLVMTGVKQGVRYSPAIAVAVKEARGPLTEFAKGRVEASRQRRLALAKATSLEDGSVLSVVHGEQPVWVVFSGDQPVAQHPDTGVSLDVLVQRVDLSKRRRPEDFPTTRERASAARHRATDTVLHRRHASVLETVPKKNPESVADADPELVGEGVGELDELGPADGGAAEAGQAERGDQPRP